MAGTSDALERGRAASVRRAWNDAFRDLAAADAEGRLELDDIERFALSAFLCGHDDTATEAWTRAHRDAVRRRDPVRAARTACLVGSGLMFRGESAPAMGWLARAGRVLEGCAECAEHALHRTLCAFPQMFGGDPDAAEPVFAAGAAAGERFADPDLSAMSRLGLGMCRLARRDAVAGMSLLDEVMVDVTCGDVSPLYAGMAYCTVIGACTDAFDLRRAREWTAALARWIDAQPGLVPFRGNCLVHRCQLMQLQGEWSGAVALAEAACGLLSGPVRWDTLGPARYQLGELHRLRGEFGPADDSYRRAGEAGRPPEPGLALLRLAQGRVDVATAMIRRAVDETSDPAARPHLLSAAVEILLEAGDIPSARAAADELAQIARCLDMPYSDALSAHAAGAVLLAEGDVRAALPKLRAAAAAWRELASPHEVARVAVLTGLACRALGDGETATMEFDAARAALERLGAVADLQRLDVLRAPQRTGRPGGLTAREVEVLRLIATGRTNRAVAAQLFLSENTVARHVSNILTKIDAPSRAAATAFAYRHGLVGGNDQN